MIRWKLGTVLLVLVFAQFLHGEENASREAFQPVPAALVRPRDGLGNVLAKLAAGREVGVAYFGGSITAANGWRPKTTAWLQQQYPKAKVREIHAAIGGTGSDLGVFRYQQDVLNHKPDLVFVEFTVNDGGAQPKRIYQAMEGIVRQTWRADPSVDLCFVYTFRVGYEEDLDQGRCPRATSAHEHIAEHYGIPSINVALRTAQLASEGKLIFQAAKGESFPEGKIVFSNDGVHPLDAGHEVYRDVIADALRSLASDAKPAPHQQKTPFVADNWEKAKLVPIDKSMLQGSWRVLDPKQGLAKNFANRLPTLWEGNKPGDSLEFRFQGTMAGLYDLVGPDGGQVAWTVDDRAGGPRPRFDSYCTYYRLASLTLAESLADVEHKVRMEVHPEQPNRSVVVDRVRNEPGFDPKKYDGTKVWIGYLMMIGDLKP